jgi:hypothetical protein
MFSFALRTIGILLAAVLFTVGAYAQQTAFVDNIKEPPQEVSEGDNIPVLVKHLPDWEKVKGKAVLAENPGALAKAVGDQPVLSVISFTAGTEGVVASYDAGKLAIIEFTTPQMATDADAKIQDSLARSAGQRLPVYRRVGNYAVFVFDPKDEQSANALIDQVKYEKVVQWLGSNPNLAQKKEHDVVKSTSEVVLNAIRITGIILVVTLSLGGLAGLLIFRSRNRQLSQADLYTDAGGMTTLNLDGLVQTRRDNLLKD